INKKHYTNTSPPIVYKDLVILGNGVGDRLVYRNDPPGDIRAFNARTGRQVWTFHTIPQPGEVGNETWGNDSWSYNGQPNAWPTQPVPAKPPAFTEQGVTLDDAFDLTPALKDAAQAELKKYRIGPLFTPPSRRGTVQRPGLIGGANWGGAAFDATNGVLFFKSTNEANIARLGKPDRSSANPRASEVDAELVRLGETNATFMNGLPLLKPPYGYLVALDLNRGEMKWRVPFGDTPSLRTHPALKGVSLPPTLGVAGAPGVLAVAGGLIFAGGGDLAFHAIDLAT